MPVNDKTVEYFYQTYHGEIYKYLIGQTGNLEVAEDITQDTFISMLRAIDTLYAQDDKQIRKWLHTTASRKAIDYHRRRRRKYRECNYEDDGEITLIHSDEFETSAAESDCMNRALATLSEEERTCLVLSVIGGYLYPEIGEMLPVIFPERKGPVSAGRVGQIIGPAKEKVRKYYRDCE